MVSARHREFVKIGLLAHVGNGNLGDESIVTAVIENVTRRVPRSRIVAFTANPVDTRVRHGVMAFRLQRGLAGSEARAGARTPERPIRRRFVAWLSARGLLGAVKRVNRFTTGAREVAAELPFLVRAYRQLSGVRLLIVAGSQQLTDSVRGPWGYPYTVFKWALLARMRHIPVAIMSVGAGPIDSAVSKWFVKRTVWMAAYRSYRDCGSRDVIRSLGVLDPGEVAPDLAFSLEPPREKAPPRPGRTIALNAMPFIWQEYDPETERRLYERYAAVLSEFIIWLVDLGYRVKCVATQMRGDRPVIDDLVSRATGKRPDVASQVEVPPVERLADLLSELRNSHLVVATRFHAAVLGNVAGRPVLALAYHQKTDHLMHQVGEPSAVVSVQHIELAHLQRTFLRLERSAPAIVERRKTILAAMRAELSQQYDTVLDYARVRRPVAVHYRPASKMRVA